MPNDAALQQLLPLLKAVTQPTIWYADENALSLLAEVPAHPLLTLITNRYDIYQQAQEKSIHAIFTDFDQKDYIGATSVEHSNKKFDRIIYRISKEKPLVHFLINQAADLLSPQGELIISGYKQEGIKSYAEKIKKTLLASGRVKKNGNSYTGIFTGLSKENKLDDQHYASIQKITISDHTITNFYSKPGTFGWDKVDKGTQLLLEALDSIYKNLNPLPQTVLDLGCGYGWIFLNLEKYNFTHITATDNNAAALTSAKANRQLITTPIKMIAGDCGNTLTETFDLVLCNPPFHQGFVHSQALTEKFITQCYQKLKPGGFSLVVTNEFISFDVIAGKLFNQQKTLLKSQGFKVVLFRK